MTNDPDVHPDDRSTPESEALPPEEDVGSGNLEEDLQDPEEKPNATDGYAPADDPTWDDEQVED